MKKLAITSGYFNPIHPGHIECFRLSLEHADDLWVIVNSDLQAEMKRKIPSFQEENFRMQVVSAISGVSRVYLSIDTDSSICKSLEVLIQEAQKMDIYDEIIFTKGGDRFATEIPEADILRQYKVRIVDGLGAKTHNSSDFLHKLKNKDDAENIQKMISTLPEGAKTENYIEIGYRPWGTYYVLEDNDRYKIKKLIIQPGKRLSLQSHIHRSEHWTVVAGTATVDIRHPDHADIQQIRILRENEGCYIPAGHLHRLANTSSDILIIVEVQCGGYTGEDDIQRYDDDFGRV